MSFTLTVNIIHFHINVNTFYNNYVDKSCNLLFNHNMDPVKLRRVRIKIGMALLEITQAELARRADLAPQTIIRVMDGAASPDLSTLEHIAKALGQKRSWIEGDGDIRDFTIPDGTKLRITSDDSLSKSAGIQITAMRANEDSPTYGAMPSADPKPIDRRNEIPVFKIVRREHIAGRNVVGLPKWLDMAVGEGNELSLCEDLVYFDKKDNFKGLHTAQVRGDSMVKTLVSGDIIVLKPFPANGVTLRALDDDDEKTSLSTWQAQNDIREGNICVVSIRGAPPTLKRVHYDTRRGPLDWKLQIVADNASVWPMFQADAKDTIVFYAKMIARAE